MLDRLWPEDAGSLLMVGAVVARALAAIGVAVLAGAGLDYILNRVRPPAEPEDFSVQAMRDRRARKRNGYLLRFGVTCLALGLAAMALVGIL